VFTPGEVAMLAGVSPRMVVKWFERGHLKGYRIPGSQHRRFLRNDVIRFFHRAGIPVPPALTGLDGRAVLVCGAEPALAAALEAELTEPLVHRAADLFDAALMVSRTCYALVLIDLHAATASEARQVLRGCRQCWGIGGVPVGVVLTEDVSDPAPWIGVGFRLVLTRRLSPAEAARLAAGVAKGGD
jgi:excisionase family DNA binding protein